jgi:cytochrome c-type biogenesis protein CcmH
MNFWIIAATMLAIPAVIISWPFFSGNVKERFTGMLVLLFMPLAGLVLYQNIGTPEAINIAAATAQQSTQAQQAHSSQLPQMDDMIDQLQQRMAKNPDDPEGWLILGRSLKTLQRYAESVTALEHANRLSPDTPLIMVELAEAILFASGQVRISAVARQLVESAVAIDPQQQKGLWLIGMAAAQDGDEALAITVWQRLLHQLDPASGVATTVAQEIEKVQARMAEGVSEVAVAEFDIPVTISIADDLAGAIPTQAILFIYIRPAGGAGMPLAVKRMAPRGFPLLLHFNDADLLRPGMSLQDFERLDISARISMSGIANAAAGDYQTELVTLDTKALAEITLHLDQRVP